MKMITYAAKKTLRSCNPDYPGCRIVFAKAVEDTVQPEIFVLSKHDLPEGTEISSAALTRIDMSYFSRPVFVLN